MKILISVLFLLFSSIFNAFSHEGHSQSDDEVLQQQACESFIKAEWFQQQIIEKGKEKLGIKSSDELPLLDPSDYLELAYMLNLHGAAAQALVEPYLDLLSRAGKLNKKPQKEGIAIKVWIYEALMESLPKLNLKDKCGEALHRIIKDLLEVYRRDKAVMQASKAKQPQQSQRKDSSKPGSLGAFAVYPDHDKKKDNTEDASSHKSQSPKEYARYEKKTFGFDTQELFIVVTITCPPCHKMMKEIAQLKRKGWNGKVTIYYMIDYMQTSQTYEGEKVWLKTLGLLEFVEKDPEDNYPGGHAGIKIYNDYPSWYPDTMGGTPSGMIDGKIFIGRLEAIFER